MVNKTAKDEFLEHISKVNKNVFCAQIKAQISYFNIDKTVDAYIGLRKNHDELDYQQFLERLAKIDVYPEAADVNFSGHIWFKDGSWSDIYTDYQYGVSFVASHRDRPKFDEKFKGF